MLSYHFRIYPSKAVQQRFAEQLKICRWLYNRLLEEINKANKVSKRQTQALIAKLKEEKPVLKLVYSKVLQMVNYQIWSNIKALAELKKKGKKVGKLRYKGKGRFKSMNFNQSGFKLVGKKLLLSKVGEVQIKLHREINGKVKGVIVKRELSGKWHAIFQVEKEPKPLLKVNKAIGIDVGIRHFLTDSDGRQIENPKFCEKTLDRIKIQQKTLSRKKKGSENRWKQRIRLARCYEKLTNQRNDFLHKLSRFYANNYDFIAIEDLNINGMVQNHNLSQKILDASWGKFLQFLGYKAESAGIQVLKVNPRGTSKEYKHGELDRDYNASLNTLERGLQQVGRGQPELTPVEMRPLLEIPASLVVEAGSSLR